MGAKQFFSSLPSSYQPLGLLLRISDASVCPQTLLTSELLTAAVAFTAFDSSSGHIVTGKTTGVGGSGLHSQHRDSGDYCRENRPGDTASLGTWTIAILYPSWLPEDSVLVSEKWVLKYLSTPFRASQPPPAHCLPHCYDFSHHVDHTSLFHDLLIASKPLKSET